MPQYIEHPALMGMRMGNQASMQRMNQYGQAVNQAAETINRQTLADQAYENELLKYQALMEAKRNPMTGAYETTSTVPVDFAQTPLMSLRLRQMGQAGIGWSGERLPGTVPMTGASYSAFVPTEKWLQSRPAGSKAITPEIMAMIASGGMPVQAGAPIMMTTNNAPLPVPPQKPRQVGFTLGLGDR